ncbi:MAG: hypothetical protein ACR2NR_13265 [Solirubrobacteraceae bacterium]
MIEVDHFVGHQGCGGGAELLGVVVDDGVGLGDVSVVLVVGVVVVAVGVGLGDVSAVLVVGVGAAVGVGVGVVVVVVVVGAGLVGITGAGGGGATGGAGMLVAGGRTVGSCWVCVRPGVVSVVVGVVALVVVGVVAVVVLVVLVGAGAVVTGLAARVSFRCLTARCTTRSLERGSARVWVGAAGAGDGVVATGAEASAAGWVGVRTAA